VKGIRCFSVLPKGEGKSRTSYRGRRKSGRGEDDRPGQSKPPIMISVKVREANTTGPTGHKGTEIAVLRNSAASILTEKVPKGSGGGGGGGFARVLFGIGDSVGGIKIDERAETSGPTRHKRNQTRTMVSRNPARGFSGKLRGSYSCGGEGASCSEEVRVLG